MILCITHSKDFYTIDKVIARLEACGEKAIRFNSDNFPGPIKISCSIDANGKISCNVSEENRTWHTDEITAVWFRKLWKPAILGNIDNSHHHGIIQETKGLLQMLWLALSDKPWINSLSSSTTVENNKLTDLQAAFSFGLQIPRTIVSNSPDEIRSFYYQLKGKMVAKMQRPVTISMEGNSEHLYTTAITEDLLSQLDELQNCPMIFQENIDKQYELRVIFINNTCYCGRIDNCQTAEGQTDWKKSTEGKWLPYALPSDVCNKISRTMSALGLEFGAIDLIKNNNNEYVFLEVNPSGEWGMLQRDLNLPIAEAIADRLIQLKSVHV